MKFANIERKDLFYAGLLISLAFAVLFSGAGSFGTTGILGFNIGFLIIFGISFLTAGLGFILHELAHKYVAVSYGLMAEFKAFYKMLFLAVAVSFFGFIIAAPGAVFIHGFGITKEKNGKISVSGPLTNIVLAVLFLMIYLIQGEGIVGMIGNLGFTINALLAAFNMIPVMPFDGAKVIAWSKTRYYVTLILAVGLFLLSLFI